jgi:type II secretory pathway component PulF
MRRVGLVLAVVGTVAGVAVLWTVTLYAVGLSWFSLPFLLVLGVAYGWMLSAYLHYRQGRRQELVHILTAAAEAELPLAEALWAYLSDRPQGQMREVWVALLLFFVAPGYYWFWHRRHCFDSKAAQLAIYLESGMSLHQALQAVPGVASREMLLAAAIGEPTGRLGFCLQTLGSAGRSRLSGLWLEILPRVYYPLALLAVVCSILAFWSIYIAPKYQKIFADFGARLPQVTTWTIQLGDLVIGDWWMVAAALTTVVVLTFLLFVSATLRWYFPVVGRAYRALVRSHLLHALSLLLSVGRPAPEALGRLRDTGYFPAPARWQLQRARRRIEQGEPLADSLRRSRILPRAMAPLVSAAERAGNLPWALAELAEHLAQRTARWVRQLSLVLFPIPIVAMGLLVGLVAYGIFVPLLQLIEGLAR